MEVLRDAGLRTIAFSLVNTDRKGYPKHEAAHVALRTVRRFLEAHGAGVSTVLFAVESGEDWKIYESTLPLYFPRSRAEEQLSMELLPEEVARLNELGDAFIPERQIRIGTAPGSGGFIEMPLPLEGAEDYQVGQGDKRSTLAAEAKEFFEDAGFTQMQENPDDVRRRLDSRKPKAVLQAEEAARQYNAYLRRARDENLSDLAHQSFLYHCGNDVSGRPVIVFVGSHLPPLSSPDTLERVLLYILLVLDPLVARDYNLIYFHTLTTAKHKPPVYWMRHVYEIFERKHKKNLKRLFIVHPSTWVRLVAWFATPFVKKQFWKKVTYVSRLLDLYEYFDPRTLVIPESILKHDQELHGALYASSLMNGGREGNEDARL